MLVQSPGFVQFQTNRRSRSLFLRSMDLDMCEWRAQGGGEGRGVRVIYFKFSASRRIYLKHYVA